MTEDIATPVADPEPLTADQPGKHAVPAPQGSDGGSGDGPGGRSGDGGGGDEPGRRTVVRRVTFWTGIGLILVGLGLLAYVAWELWGTNWIAHKHQKELTSQVQEDWAVGNGCYAYCPKGATIALIRIPKFGKNYVIPVLEGTDKATVLDKGAFGHFDDTAEAGQEGNFALAAHRVTHGEPLRHMPDLRPGDKVIVETRKFTYTYVLDTNPNDLVIPFTGTWVIDPLPHNPDGGVPNQVKWPNHHLITLTTCSEIFHTDNRMIAFGHLQSSVRKTKLHPVDP